MTPQRRCNDEKLPGLWNALNRFLSNGIIRALLIFISIGICTFLSTTFIVLPSPKDYVAKTDFKVLADAHKEDIKGLEERKQDKDEYKIAHQALRENTELKFNAILMQMKENHKMTTKIYNMHLKNGNDDD